MCTFDGATSRQCQNTGIGKPDPINESFREQN